MSRGSAGGGATGEPAAAVARGERRRGLPRAVLRMWGRAWLPRRQGPSGTALGSLLAADLCQAPGSLTPTPPEGGLPGPGPPMHAWRPVSEASVRKSLPLGWDSTPADGFATWRGRFLPHGVCTMSAWDGKVPSVSAARSLTGALPRTPVAHGNRTCP